MLIGLQFFRGKTMFRKVLLSLLTATTLLAQTERGNITGVVSDQTGAAVAGAQVMITNVATNTTLNVPTTSAGEYNAPSLTPGEYRSEIFLSANAGGPEAEDLRSGWFKHSVAIHVTVESPLGVK